MINQKCHARCTVVVGRRSVVVLGVISTDIISYIYKKIH